MFHGSQERLNLSHDLVTQCGRGAGTHGDVLNLHTEVFETDTRGRGGERRERGGGHRQFC